MTPLKHKRLAAGLTQQNIAAALGVSQSAVAKWDAGRCKPAPANYPKLAALLGLPADEVVRLFAEQATAATATATAETANH